MPSSTTAFETLISTASAWPRLVLGSTSPYRKELLARFGLPFETCSPRTDEQARPGEAPSDLALRLAQAKAEDVCRQLRDAQDASRADQADAQGLADVLVIGSDQVAELDGQALGKPGNHQRATDQLKAMRGRDVRFHTAVCVMRPQRAFASTCLSTVTVTFRDLSDADIETYLLAEQPYDCAGSAKAETLGIVLLERILSDDPTALIGLPLIATARLMRDAGADPLTWRSALR